MPGLGPAAPEAVGPVGGEETVWAGMAGREGAALVPAFEGEDEEGRFAPAGVGAADEVDGGGSAEVGGGVAVAGAAGVKL